MLRSTFYTFTTALRGMNAAQKQLDITGQNIANAKTPGYTRQRADLYSSVPGYGDRYATKMSTMAGQGAYIDNIEQIRDQFLDVRFRNETAIGSEEATKLGVMKDMERFLDEISKAGLQDSFNKFVTSMQQLSKNVESPEFDNLARNAAQSLAMQLNHYARQLKDVREGQEYTLREVDVPKINETLKKIAELNKSIREVQSAGSPALELKDERNLLLDELSGYANIEVNYHPNYYAGDRMVEDVSVKLIGKKSDGTRTERTIVYNGSAAKLNVETPLIDKTQRSIVTVDSTDIPAKELADKIEDLLRTVEKANGDIVSMKNRLINEYAKGQKYLSDSQPIIDKFNFDNFAFDQDTKDLIDKIFNQGMGAGFDAVKAQMDGKTAAEISTLLDDTIKDIGKALGDYRDGKGDIFGTLKKAMDANVDATKKYNELLDKKPPATAKEIADAEKAKIAAQQEEQVLRQYADGLIEYKSNLERFKKDFDASLKSRTNADKALEDTLKALNPPITLNSQLDSAALKDYGSLKYTFAGKTEEWKLDGSRKTIDRHVLEDGLGIDFSKQKVSKDIFSKGYINLVGDDFENVFDFEDLNCLGALRGGLKMLNDNGKFDYKSDPDTVRGTGYYERLLDELAEKLGTTLNALNDRKSTADVVEEIFQKDPNSPIQDRFTAENIRISQGWLEGKWTLTASQETQPGKTPTLTSAKNENLLRMISTITKRMGYTTPIRAEQNDYGLYMGKDGKAVADTKDKDGNYIQTKEYEEVKISDKLSVWKPKEPVVEVNPPKKIADHNGIDYKDDGTLDAKTVDLTKNVTVEKIEPTPTGESPKYKIKGGAADVVADGRDKQGNYTLRFEKDATGNVTKTYEPPKWIADASGVMQYKDANGKVVANHRDDRGNYYMREVDANGKIITDKPVANKDGILYKMDANGNPEKSKNGAYELDGKKTKLSQDAPEFVYDGTFQEYLTNISNTLGLDISTTGGLVKNRKTVLTDITMQRDSISKVSIDEEGVNMLQFQKAYNASARLMTVLDEAVDKIINGMGIVGR